MASTDTIDTNKRNVRRIPEEVAEKRNIDYLDEIFDEDMIDHSPLGETRGREALKATSETLLEAFPDLSVTVEEVVAEGDTVVLRVTQRGTHEGEFMGIEPTGREFEIGITTTHHLKDGKVVERWVQPDMLGLLQQLGVVELSGE